MGRAIFSISLCLLALSILVIARAPTHFIWKLAILATEFGHWFALLSIFLAALILYDGSGLRWISVVVLSLSAALFITPTFQAFRLAPKWQNEFELAFGGVGDSQGKTSFSLLKLWKFSFSADRNYEEFTYATREHQDLHLHFYESQIPAVASPVVIVIHGGSWNSGDPSQLSPLNSVLTKEGFHVASIEYRHAPQNPWPAQKEDILEAIQFLKSKSSKLRLDVDSFFLLGRSAGGHLAEAVAYQQKSIGILGVIAFYAPADLIYSYETAKPTDIIQSKQILEDLIGQPYFMHESAFADASPIRSLHKDSPPTLLFHGERDELVSVEQSRRLSEALQGQNVRSFYLEIPWATHGFDFNLHGPSGQISTHYILRWLELLKLKR